MGRVTCRMLPLKILRLQLLCDRPLIFDINDHILTDHYGFTEEELDFIINYDIKYRMGQGLEEDDE